MAIFQHKTNVTYVLRVRTLLFHRAIVRFFTRPSTRIPRDEDNDEEMYKTRLITRNIPFVQFLKQSVLEALHETR